MKIGTKKIIGDKKQKQILRNGHVFYNARESKVLQETIGRENVLRKVYYEEKKYLSVSRNPINPIEDDKSNFFYLDLKEPDGYYYKEPEGPKNYEKDPQVRVLEHVSSIKCAQNRHDNEIAALKARFSKQANSVEASLIRNRMQIYGNSHILDNPHK